MNDSVAVSGFKAIMFVFLVAHTHLIDTLNSMDSKFSGLPSQIRAIILHLDLGLDLDSVCSFIRISLSILLIR